MAESKLPIPRACGQKLYIGSAEGKEKGSENFQNLLFIYPYLLAI